MNSVPGLGPVTSARVTHPNSLAHQAKAVVRVMATAKRLKKFQANGSGRNPGRTGSMRCGI